MEITESEFRKIIAENGEPANPAILKFFNATNWKKAGIEVPWCAAFISCCMVNCGSEIIRLKYIASARASDLAKWGYSSNSPHYGALAVLYPVTTGASGHVGFVTRFNSTRTELLGGNQNNAQTNAISLE